MAVWEGLTNSWSYYFMANRWGNGDRLYLFIFFGSKIIVDGDFSHEIEGRLLLRRKAMTKLDSILKSINRAGATRRSQTRCARRSVLPCPRRRPAPEAARARKKKKKA